MIPKSGHRFSEKSCSSNKLEWDDDSKKVIPAPESSIFVVLRDQSVQQPHAPARAPAPVHLRLRRAHAGAGDVEVGPWVLSTKRWRNCAAVIEPALRPPVFFTSANLESMSLSYSGASGMRQTFSAVSCPAFVSRSASVSSLENRPACSLPSATRIAPVKVARLIINFGLKRVLT